VSSADILFVVAGALAGGFINGLAGTGTALFALGFFLVALEPVSAVAVVSLMSVLTGLQGLWEVREALGRNVPRLLRFIVPGLAGVPVGILLLSHIDAETLKLIIAALLVVYGGFFSFQEKADANYRAIIIDLAKLDAPKGTALLIRESVDRIEEMIDSVRDAGSEIRTYAMSR